MLAVRDAALLETLSEGDRKLLEEYQRVLEANPLLGFTTRRNPRQEPFLQSRKRVQAYFGGNGSGKTTALVVKALAQVVDRDVLPEHLAAIKRRDGQAQGRLLSSSFSQMHTVLLPEIKTWAPQDQLLGGSFDKAFDKTNFILRFRNGSWVQFNTYDQEVQKLAGGSFDFIGYDEPPPKEHRIECSLRLRRSEDGFEMFTLTPTEGIGDWLFGEFWEPFEAGVEDPDVFVTVASTDDNQYLSDETRRKMFPTALSKEELAARKHGRFVALHGKVYDRFDPSRHVAPAGPLPEICDIYCAIDPGMQFMCAVLWVYVEPDGRLTVFRERAFTDGEAIPEIAQKIHEANGEIGRLPRMYLIDPSARNRVNQTGRNDQEAFAEHGIVPVPAHNAVPAGINRVKARLDAEPAALQVMASCSELLREFKLYRWKGDKPKADAPKDDRRSRPVKKDDHLLDCLRYICMAKPYAPQVPSVPDDSPEHVRAAAAALAAAGQQQPSHPQGPGVYA